MPGFTRASENLLNQFSRVFTFQEELPYLKIDYYQFSISTALHDLLVLGEVKTLIR